MRSSWRFATLLALVSTTTNGTVRESKITEKLSRYAVTVPVNAKQKVMFYIYKSIGTKKRASYYVTNEVHYEVAVQVYNQLKKGVV